MKTSYLTIISLLIALLFGYKYAQLRQENTDYQTKTGFLTAIQDSLHLSEDKYGRVVAEKRVISADLGSIRAKYAELSRNQRDLLREINDSPRKQGKNVVSATQVQQTAVIRLVDSVLVPGPADMAWKHKSDTLSYDIQVQDSTLIIHRLEVPNSLSLVTYRDKRKDLHVQVTNSNPIYRTADIDQVVLKKPKTQSKLVKILLFTAGVITGALLPH